MHRIIDWRKVVALTSEDILTYEDSAHTLTVRARHQTFALPRQELLHIFLPALRSPQTTQRGHPAGEMLPEGDPALIRERVEVF